MNNLKFRAYIKSINKVVDVLKIDFKSNTLLLDIDSDEMIPKSDYWWYETTLNFEDVELMQSTGLFDKNGVEIFEGDIVQYLDGEYSFVGVVEYSAFGIFAKNKYDNYNFEDFADENTKKADVVVIGNIYENKELLENDR